MWAGRGSRCVRVAGWGRFELVVSAFLFFLWEEGGDGVGEGVGALRLRARGCVAVLLALSPLSLDPHPTPHSRVLFVLYRSARTRLFALARLLFHSSAT